MAGAAAPAAPDSFDAFLSRGIGPKTGMWRIPLPTESYEHPSVPLSSERLVNLMIETQPPNAHSDAALVSTGGLQYSIAPGSFGPGPVIAMVNDFYWYVLSADHFYRVDTSLGFAVVTDLGFVGRIAFPAGTDVSSIMETIACGLNDVVVCVPPNAFTCTHTATGLTALAGVSAFPAGGARWVAYLGGYFIFGSAADPGNFFISALLDPLTYDALDFASANNGVVSARRGFIVNRELWLSGDGGIEVWYLLTNPGNGFPFAIQPGAAMTPGPRSVRSCAVGKDENGKESFWWLSRVGQVYYSVGYTGIPISTRGLAAVILQFSTPQILWAFCYEQGGHAFYCLTLAGTTIVYDRTEKKWHNRSSSTDGGSCWLPSCSIQLGPQAIFGDSTSGSSFDLVPLRGDDNGLPLIRSATFPPLWSRTSRAFVNRLEIEMEVGGASSPGNITVTWSDDGGHTYTGGPRVMSAGTLTQLRKRVFTTRLGSYRQRVYKVVAFDHVTIYGVSSDVNQPMAGG